ncbi:MAG TPA: S-layer homology domain-containing protein [Egicoccus sp.]|nr:S-layer homology domain-containing protein [Egicoccus sp.]HSK25101.1 S-layer homology domain-containing protein [Egicoccus sp.]
MQHTRTPRRALATAAAAALVVALVPGAAFAAEARDTAPVCEGEADAEAPEDAQGTTHEDAIRCVSGLEIAEGYDDGTYRPGQDVTRAQMAAFVGRTLLVADAVPPEAAENLESGSFPDTPGTAHEAWIELLAELGVVTGKNDGTYGYSDPVTRGQMAAFLTRAIDQAHGRALDGSEPPAAAGDDFDDTEGSAFEDQIQQLADAGIYVGDGEGTADPGGHVTRGQMASFLARTAAYLDEIRRWRPTYEAIDYTVPMSPDNVVGADGEEGASGTIRIVVDEIERAGAYAISVEGVTPPYAGTPVAVRLGGPDDGDGAAVITPSTNPAGDLTEDGQASGQLTLSASLDVDALAETPEGFYVDVRTQAHPDGAIRGQLPDGGDGAGLPVPLPDIDDLLGELNPPGDGDGGDDGSPLDPVLEPIGDIIPPPELPIPGLGLFG